MPQLRSQLPVEKLVSAPYPHTPFASVMPEKNLLTKPGIDSYQNLLAIMPTGIVVIDGEGKVKDCNAKAEEILGEPLLNQLWVNVINRAFQPQADDGHQISLKDGRKIHIETRAIDFEPGQLIILTDLTKSRQLQEEQKQQQKLSSMGKMIASLAHQIRTPLSAAILYSSQLNQNNLDEDIKQKFNNQLLERLHFMERQITDMLNFVKGERKQKQKISPIDLFKQLKMLKRDFPEYVCFEFQRISNKRKLLIADIDAIRGAVVNLIENACDACKEKKQPSVVIHFSIEDELRISVIDNGVGITKAQQKHIFEPFYTDKISGNGLGLAVVHGVVIDHGGRIKVNSFPNEETSVDIYFPLTKELSSVTSVINNKREKINEC